MNFADLYAGAEHQSFKHEGGPTTAVLVHGFPGTPAEMRPLAEELGRRGWTVHVPLLPGFGPELGTLLNRRPEDWIRAVEDLVKTYREQDRPTALIGFSMGSAISIHAAHAAPPHQLILLAPFWRLGDARQRLIWSGFRRFVREIRPFASIDLSDPSVERGLRDFLPQGALDDPEAIRRLKELTIPTSFLEGIRRLGEQAFAKAREIHVDTLVVQGSQDQVVQAARSEQLAGRLPGPATYREVPAGHELLDPQGPAWTEILDMVLSHTQRLNGRGAI